MGALSREALDKAKAMIRKRLDRHPDAGVRFVNKFAELSDDHPTVQRIALALTKPEGRT